MLRKTPILILSFLCFAAAVPMAGAQDLHPSRRPSPIGIAKTHLGDTYVKITYGRPYMRNRAIFGMNTDDTTFLVPFGQVWRTGANEATEITTTGAVTLAGQPLAAGTYALFTEPGPEAWVVHLSPQLGLDGTGRLSPDGTFTPDVYNPGQDVLVFTVPASTVEETVDQFTIAFDDAEGGMHLVLRWEKTEVRIPIEASS
jgi:hypothetical protein